MNIKTELIIGAFGVIAVNLLLYKSYTTLKIPDRKNNLIQTANTILTIDQVDKHSSDSDCWVIIQNSVYVVTGYLNLHPGDAERILPYCGKNATEAFITKGGQGSHSTNANDQLSQLKIGEIGKNQTATETEIRKNVQKLPVNIKRESEDDD